MTGGKLYLTLYQQKESNSDRIISNIIIIEDNPFVHAKSYWNQHLSFCEGFVYHFLKLCIISQPYQVPKYIVFHKLMAHVRRFCSLYRLIEVIFCLYLECLMVCVCDFMIPEVIYGILHNYIFLGLGIVATFVGESRPNIGNVAVTRFNILVISYERPV